MAVSPLRAVESLAPASSPLTPDLIPPPLPNLNTVHLSLHLKRSGAPLARPCRGVDDISLVLELRIAQMSGCGMADESSSNTDCSAVWPASNGNAAGRFHGPL